MITGNTQPDDAKSRKEALIKDRHISMKATLWKK